VSPPSRRGGKRKVWRHTHSIGLPAQYAWLSLPKTLSCSSKLSYPSRKALLHVAMIAGLLALRAASSIGSHTAHACQTMSLYPTPWTTALSISCYMLHSSTIVMLNKGGMRVTEELVGSACGVPPSKHVTIPGNPMHTKRFDNKDAHLELAHDSSGHQGHILSEPGCTYGRPSHLTHLGRCPQWLCMAPLQPRRPHAMPL
jgi:hypothetical protein